MFLVLIRRRFLRLKASYTQCCRVPTLALARLSCLEEDIHDIIAHLKFGDDRFRGLSSAESEILPFPIDFDGVLTTLSGTKSYICTRLGISQLSTRWDHVTPRCAQMVTPQCDQPGTPRWSHRGVTWRCDCDVITALTDVVARHWSGTDW